MSPVFLWYQNQLSPQRTAGLKCFAVSGGSEFELTNTPPYGVRASRGVNPEVVTG